MDQHSQVKLEVHNDKKFPNLYKSYLQKNEKIQLKIKKLLTLHFLSLQV